MKRLSIAWTLAIVLILPLASGVASAADPTTADCLAASDASFKAGNEHRLRAERAQLLVCAAPSCPADIRKECTDRVTEMSAQVPTIIFGVKSASGSDLSAVKVTMDGEVLAERLQGTALSIDPGEHTFTFETQGEAPVVKTYLIQQAQKDRRETIAFGPPPLAVTSPPPVAAAPPPPPKEPLPVQARPTPDAPSNPVRTAGYAVGGTGIALLGVAIVATVLAGNAESSISAGGFPNSGAITSEASTVNTYQGLAGAGYALGGTALVGGVLLVIFGHPSSGSQSASSPRWGVVTW